MSMAIQFQAPVRRTPPTINLSALIDIIFILVIFIMLAANFHRINNLGVNLPSADAAGQADTESLVITVPPTGPVLIGDQEVVLDAVRAYMLENRDVYKGVLLIADEAASVQRAVQILNDAQHAGFESVGIATQQPGGTP